MWKRLNKRKISIADVKNAINTGKIIEFYYEDYPYPSCLILGCNINNRIIHIVCGISNNLVHMITAYYPDDETAKNIENIVNQLKSVSMEVSIVNYKQNVA